MTLALMKQLLTDPVIAINLAKRMRNYNELIALLIIEWLLVGIGLAVSLRTFGITATSSAAILLTLAGILITLFFGLLIQIVFHILGGKGTYWTGLTSAVYAKFPLAFGFFLGSVLFTVPFFGAALGAILIVVMAVISISTLYRALKELFQVEVITAWIGVGILVTALLVSFWLSIILLSPSAPFLLNFLRLPSLR
jgi:hypothetical protein